MSVSAVFVLDLKGRVLLSRDYRGDVSLKVAEKFIIKLNELEEAGKARSCAVRLQDTCVPSSCHSADSEALQCWPSQARLVQW